MVSLELLPEQDPLNCINSDSHDQASSTTELKTTAKRNKKDNKPTPNHNKQQHTPTIKKETIGQQNNNKPQQNKRHTDKKEKQPTSKSNKQEWKTEIIKKAQQHLYICTSKHAHTNKVIVAKQRSKETRGEQTNKQTNRQTNKQNTKKLKWKIISL